MVLSLKTWKSRSLPGLPRTERFAPRHDDLYEQSRRGSPPRRLFLFVIARLVARMERSAIRGFGSRISLRSCRLRCAGMTRRGFFATLFARRRHQRNSLMATNRVYRIAVIPGDGIGKEVMPEGVRVLE